MQSLSVGQVMAWCWRGRALGLVLLGVMGLAACQTGPNQLEQSVASIPQTLVVSGWGMVEIPKTVTRVTLGVEVQGQTTAEVQRSIAQKSTAVVKLLRSRPIVSKLATTGMTFNPRYSYKDGQQRIDGYTGTNMVQFEVPPDKMGTLLDEAIRAGATRIDQVTLVASDDAMAAAQQEAIDKAARNAQSQAESALGALKLKQDSIVSVQINDAKVPLPPPYDGENFPAAKTQSTVALPQTPIVPGQQRIEAFVTLQVRYQMPSS